MTNKIVTCIATSCIRILIVCLLACVGSPGSRRADEHAFAMGSNMPTQLRPANQPESKAPGEAVQRRKERTEPAAKLPIGKSSDGEPGGGFLIDLPYKVEINKPFDLDIWLAPQDPKFNGPVQVFMEQNSRMQYKPRVFTLKPGIRKTIQARILKSDSGLAEIIATADGWEDYRVQVDAGFSAKIRSSLKPSIESGKRQSFTIDFIDTNGKPVSLDGPVSVTLQSSNAKIRQVGKMSCDDEGQTADDGQNSNTNNQNGNLNTSRSSGVRRTNTTITERWCDNIRFTVERGTSSTPLIEVKPETIFPEKGVILVEVRINGDFFLLNDQISFDILPRWWVPLLMTIVGGLLYSLYKVMKGQDKPKGHQPDQRVSALSFFSITVLTGIFAGVLAYLLGNYGILGFKVDSSSLQGYVILGFLFSYVGVDAILKAATQRGEQPKTDDLDRYQKAEAEPPPAKKD